MTQAQKSASRELAFSAHNGWPFLFLFIAIIVLTILAAIRFGEGEEAGAFFLALPIVLTCAICLGGLGRDGDRSFCCLNV